MTRKTSDVDEFASALEKHAPQFEVSLDERSIAALRDYYSMVNEWNARLHLVAPCSPEEFATRHILESLLALRYLPRGAFVVDIGSGAGLPIIPCLIVRPDLLATLFEASPRKAIFLREALGSAGAGHRASVMAQRFEHRSTPNASVITCRALDRFTKMFRELVGWSPPASTLLLFGGPSLQKQIEEANLKYTTLQVPASDQRFLFRLPSRATDKEIPFRHYVDPLKR
ncbi:MAG: RsmG family class I SAM-dependent methyltransferase [Pyrinomonadaceae bacterium]